MLRITVRDQAGTRIVLEGKLASVWVKELKDCCKDVLSRSDPRDVFVELADVTFVDAAGRELLAELSRKGVHLVSNDIATDALVDDIRKNGYEERERTPAIRLSGREQADFSAEMAAGPNADLLSQPEVRKSISADEISKPRRVTP
jgi:ABC-type transporter Mla MlaB component